MSLILDALRKSEAERRRGQAPDLFAPLAVPRAAAPSASWSPWRRAAAGALVVALLAATWWWQRSPIAVTDPTDATAPGHEQHAPASPVAAPSPSPTARQAAASAVPARAPVSVSAEPALPVASARRTAEAARAAAPSRPRGDPDERSPLDPPAVTPEPASPAGSPAAPVDVAPPRLPRLGDLDPALRASLPPLKLSMHVWAENPDQRFAIIDGQRVTEGSELSGTLVREIRRDGVLLSIGGRDVLLPR